MRTMRKNLFLVLLCVFLLLFCFCCTSDSDNLFVDDNLESIENFPTPIKEYGEAFALELREIVINLHKRELIILMRMLPISLKIVFTKTFIKRVLNITRPRVLLIYFRNSC